VETPLDIAWTEFRLKVPGADLTGEHAVWTLRHDPANSVIVHHDMTHDHAMGTTCFRCVIRSNRVRCIRYMRVRPIRFAPPTMSPSRRWRSRRALRDIYKILLRSSVESRRRAAPRYAEQRGAGGDPFALTERSRRTRAHHTRLAGGGFCRFWCK
jgi:hypothetical protein